MSKIRDGKRIYGAWAGNPKGTEEDVTLCIEEVSSGGRAAIFHQCSRKRGFGPEGLYCRQHDPAAVRERDRKSTERYQAEMDRHAAPFRKIERLEAENARLRKALEDAPEIEWRIEPASVFGRQYREWYMKTRAEALKNQEGSTHRPL